MTQRDHLEIVARIRQRIGAARMQLDTVLKLIDRQDRNWPDKELDRWAEYYQDVIDEYKELLYRDYKK